MHKHSRLLTPLALVTLAMSAFVFQTTAAPASAHRVSQRIQNALSQSTASSRFAATVPAAQREAAVQQADVHPITGRQFARPMGFQAADWLDREEREIEEEPEKALDAIGIARGSTVADVGAGSGYMTVRLAARVGAAGKVYANDLQPEMLQMLRDRIRQDGISNVTLVQGTVNDPKLPAAALDLVLMVDVYHEFSEPQQMLRGIRQALKPGGRIVLLEYRKEDPDIPIRFEHTMTVEEAKAEIEAEGFRLTRVDERLPRQHILIFTKR